MSDNTCGRCVFFAKPDDSKYESECRFDSPTRIVVNSYDHYTGVVVDTSVVSGWPNVSDDDWCGKFKAISSGPANRMGFHHGQGE